MDTLVLVVFNSDNFTSMICFALVYIKPFFLLKKCNFLDAHEVLDIINKYICSCIVLNFFNVW